MAHFDHQRGSQLTNNNRHDDPDTRKVIEDMKKGASNIMVAVRLRPLWQQELSRNEFSIVKILDGKLVVLHDPMDAHKHKVENELGKNRTREKKYAFDFAFDENSTTEEVFNSTASFLTETALEGFNSTVFAYGTTGSGKTHTMLGTADNPGITFLAMKQIFEQTRSLQHERDYTIKMSFLEIYNENIDRMSDKIVDLSNAVERVNQKSQRLAAQKNILFTQNINIT